MAVIQNHTATHNHDTPTPDSDSDVEPLLVECRFSSIYRYVAESEAYISFCWAANLFSLLSPSLNFKRFTLYIIMDTETENMPINNDFHGGNQVKEKEILPILDVAICGIALRLPGNIRNCDDYWSLLYNDLDARGPIPASRYDTTSLEGHLAGPGHGYYLDQDLSCFDNSFFSLPKSELDKLDPQ
jgi:hypothetical protein